MRTDPGTASGSLRSRQVSKAQIYVEVHEFAASSGTHAFHYSLAAPASSAALTPRFPVQLEERRIEIDTSQWKPPKLGLRFKPRRSCGPASVRVLVGGHLEWGE